PLCLLAAVGLWTVQRRTAIFLGAWLASAFLGVAMGGNWWAHYAIQLIGPLSVGAAAGVIRLHRGWAPLRWFATAVLGASVLLSVPYFLLPAAEGSWALYGRPAYIMGEDVADYVESRTTGQDRIFVAYSQPEMHYLSERRSPVPYLYREFFVAHPEGFGPLLGMMERGDVDVVVTVGRTLPEIDPDGRFEEALALHYQVAREFRVGDYVDLEQAPMEYEPVRVYIPRQPTEQVSAESDTLVLSLPVQPGDQPRRGQRAA